MVLSSIVKIFTWIGFGFACYFSVLLVINFSWWEVYDSIFLMTIVFALAVAITFSHSYGLNVKNIKDELKKRAIKADGTNIHSYFCWKIIAVWMTIAPLYCTTVVVFIGTQAVYGGQAGGQANRIVVYSILSLVISLSVYAVKPNYRAHNFIEQFKELRPVLLKYLDVKKLTKEEITELTEAVWKSQEIRDDPW